MNKIQYIVKPEEGVVIGLLKVDLAIYFKKITSQMCQMHRFVAYDCLYPVDPIVIKGVAKCDAEDTFDEEYGKKLVEARIYRKLNRKIKLTLRRAIINLWKAAKKLQDVEIEYGRKEHALQEDLNSYFK